MRDDRASRKRMAVPAQDSPGSLRSYFPQFPSRFIGRQDEMAAVRSLLGRLDVRLLTLVGPPGIGKTRLTVEILRASASAFEHGGAFIDLAPIDDPALVPHAIAKALGVVDAPGRDTFARLIEYLEHKRMLLLLDNVEQVIGAARQIGDLLAACSGVKILATGREPLHLSWEHEIPVAPLSVPELTRPSRADALSGYAAVALFLDRARSIRPDFTLTAENALAVAEICVRLDGLPLAIEMAAARMKSFTPADIVRRLDDRLEILTAGARDIPERHRTLRSAIAWSYDLLAPADQALFRRLAVFSGGCAPDAAQAICGEGVLGGVGQGLSALVDKSLLRHEPQRDGRSRYAPLESLREFGLEQLAARGELQAVRDRHAAYFVALAEQAEPHQRSREQSVWMEVLKAEHANIQAAFGWCLESGSVELGLRGATALLWFWGQGGHWEIGRHWLERFLGSPAVVPSALRANGLSALGQILFYQGEQNRAHTILQESLAEFRRLGDERNVIRVLYALTMVLQWRDEYANAEAAAGEALTLARRLNDPVEVSEGLSRLGNLAVNRGDYETAATLLREVLATGQPGDYGRRRGLIRYGLGRAALFQGHVEEAAAGFEEALAIFHDIDSKWDAARTVVRLGEVAALRGDADAATRFYEEGLSRLTDLGDIRWTARAFRGLAIIAMKRGDKQQALSRIQEGLRRCLEFGAKYEAADCLDTAAILAASAGQEELAATLSGAVERLREDISGPRTPVEEPLYAHMLTLARRRLGTRAFEVAHAAGRAMTLEQVGALVMSWEFQPAETGSTAKRAASPLTRREGEVAGLIAQGFSNRQIAAALFITEHTVESHVEHILNKLGFDARTQIAAWAAVSENRSDSTR